MRTWALLATTGLALGGLVACGDDGGGDGDGGSGSGASGSGASGSGGSDTGGGGTGASGTGASGTGASGTGASGGGGTGEDCVDEASEAACLSCCDQAFADALAEVDGFFTTNCLCGVGSPCETECAAACLDPNAAPPQDCLNCAEDVQDPAAPDECVTDALTDCSESASCAPLVACWETC